MISISKRIQSALEFALSKHHHQTRKLSDVPYSVHPISVAMLLLEVKESEDVIISALLHDTIEDTDTTYEEISEMFGPSVCLTVKECSEDDKTLSWEGRKEHTILNFPRFKRDSQIVMLADKIHNLSSIKVNLELEGHVIWNSFKRGYSLQKWYYKSLYDVFLDSRYLTDTKILEIYVKLYDDVFRDEVEE